MELPVCSQEGGHHFSLRLPADSPLPGHYGDMDHPRKHCHSSCPLKCLLILSLPKTNRTGRRNWLLITPMWTHQVLPLDHLPSLCHSSFQAHHCGDLSPSWSSPWLLWWEALLSCSPDDGTPLDVLSDFNIHPEKLCSSEFIYFFSTFDLRLSPSPPTHKAGNQLDLVFTKQVWMWGCRDGNSIVCCLHVTTNLIRTVWRAKETLHHAFLFLVMYFYVSHQLPVHVIYCRLCWVL